MPRGKSRGRGGFGPARGGASDGPSEADGMRWLTTYGDMVTLLMAFFVILFSFSQIDVQRFETFLSGLESPFGNPAMSDSLLDGGAGIVGGAAGTDPDPVANLGQDPMPNPAEETIDVSVQGLRETAGEIEAALESAGLDELVDYQIDHRGLVLTIATDAVLFETGSTVLSDQGRHLMAQIAPVLARVPNDVRVEGHTDDVPLSRAGYTNWNLSTDRAVAVLTLLHEAHGVDPKRLVAVGYGEFRPISPNESAQGRAANRRVEIIIAVPETITHGSQ